MINRQELDHEGFPPTIVLRHKKENLKKCSLQGLERRPDFRFYQYPLQSLPPLKNYILLSLDAPIELSLKDKEYGLLVLDATWRYAEQMSERVLFPIPIAKRSLPSHFITAYPRRQKDCKDPTRGLASIEAITAAYAIMGRSVEGLLENYYWKGSFIEKNKSFLL